MRYTLLGQAEVSVLGLGCGNFGGIGSAPELFGMGEDEAAAFALLDCAREQGITLLDTANSYGGGRSEEMVGRWLRSRGDRDAVVLTTKVRNRVGPGPDDEGLSPQHIREQIELSLGRLQTDRIDLYLAHEPDPAVPIEETVAAFDVLVRAGKIRAYGLSNYSGPEIESAAAAAMRGGLLAPTNVQNSFSLLDRDAEADSLPACSQHGIGFTAFSPLAGGWLTGKYRAGEPFPTGSRMTLRPQPYDGLRNAKTYGALEALESHAKERGCDLTSLALAWVLGERRVTAAIVGPRTPQQLLRLVGAVELELAGADRDVVTQLAGGRGGPDSS